MQQGPRVRRNPEALLHGRDLDAGLLDYHAAGRGAMFTRINRPLRLLGSRPYPSQSLATKAEIGLKRLDRSAKLAWARENPAAAPPA
mgnify:CR=1 FL=1